jgi:hydrogenase maturation protease
MNDMTPAPIVVIGQGNDYRGDDGAGPEVIRKLKEGDIGIDDRVTFIAGPIDIADIIDRWQNTALTIFVDAVFSKGTPGQIHIFHPLVSPLPEEWTAPVSTHDAPPFTQALELGRTLKRLPRELIVYGIEGQDYTHKTELTPTVNRAVMRVVDLISEKIIMFLSETHN